MPSFDHQKSNFTAVEWKFLGFFPTFAHWRDFKIGEHQLTCVHERDRETDQSLVDPHVSPHGLGSGSGLGLEQVRIRTECARAGWFGSREADGSGGDSRSARRCHFS